MKHWQLLERQPDGTYTALDDECEADTFGKAVELLLPAEVCAATKRYDASILDDLCTTPDHTTLTANGHTYKVIPADSDLTVQVEADATAIVETLRNRGVVE